MNIQRPFGRRLLYVLFFVSGATSLIFETLWTRSFVLVFGATEFAVATVLAVFMAGLALGGALAGRIADRVERASGLVVGYGLLEGGIGVYALVLPKLIDGVGRVAVWAWRSWHPGLYGMSLLRLALAAVVLLPPTLAMGASLPLLTRYVSERSDSLGERAGRLYAMNTAGALAGAGLAGFVLLPMLGLFQTNLLACLADLAVFAGACWLGASDSARRMGSRREPSRRNRGFAGRLAVGVALASGLLAMGYQVAWNRLLALILGSSAYAFTLILLAVLAGIALGSGLYAGRNTRDRDQFANLASIQILAGATGLVGVLLADSLPGLFLASMKALGLSAEAAFAVKFLLAAAVVLPPSFFMGMVFPAVAEVLGRQGMAPGRATGRAYAWNTVGAIAGALLAGFLAVPFLGLQSSLLLFGMGNLAVAVALCAFVRARRAAVGRLVGGLLVAGSALVFLKPWNLQALTAGVFRLSVYYQAGLVGPGRHGRARIAAEPGWRAWVERAKELSGGLAGRSTWLEPVVASRMVFFREGMVSTVSVDRTALEGLGGRFCWELLALQVSGKTDASVCARYPRPRGRNCAEVLQAEPGPPEAFSPFGDVQTEVLSGMLGPLLAERRVERALVVGWGSGLTVAGCLAAGVPRVDAVELERQVLRGARWFWPFNGAADRDPRVRVVEGDGRTFLFAAKPESYDLVVSEPSNPWMTGAANLFTVDYFRLVASRLRPRGLFVQWVQLYEIAPWTARVLLASFAEVFPHVLVFRPAPHAADLLLVGSRSPLHFNLPLLRRRMARPRMRRLLEAIGIRDVYQFLVRSVTGSVGVRRYSRGAPLNTDDRNLIEYRAPRDMVEFRRFDPEAIVRSLEEAGLGLLQRIRGGGSELPVRLARAYLESGRLEQARGLLAVSSGPKAAFLERVAAELEASARACERLGAMPAPPALASAWKTIWSLPPGESLLKVIEAVGVPGAPARDSSRVSESPVFLVLGCRAAELGMDTEALWLLWAARQAARGTWRKPAERTLVSFLRTRKLTQFAFEIVTQTLTESDSGR